PADILADGATEGIFPVTIRAESVVESRAVGGFGSGTEHPDHFFELRFGELCSRVGGHCLLEIGETGAAVADHIGRIAWDGITDLVSACRPLTLGAVAFCAFAGEVLRTGQPAPVDLERRQISLYPNDDAVGDIDRQHFAASVAYDVVNWFVA